ncbi:hypothetical protein BD413DRAFT_615953 [Trametes elegans]|nr:hypothetical protein BD413DRAFT_615953 [Trametes elegans]
MIEETNGKKLIVWRGLLTDWELAKRVPKDDSLQRARANGSSFLSRTSSTRTARSRWLVLVYYAIRYLRHSVANTTSFVIEYFDRFQDDGPDKQFCGGPKSNVVHRCIIEYTGCQLVQFRNDTGGNRQPLNKMLYFGSMPLFSARYQVLRRQEIEENAGEEPDESAEELDPEHFLLQGKVPPAVTADAAQLNSHDEVLKAMQNSISGPGWPEADTVGDQLSPAYDPRRIIIDTVATASAATDSGTSIKLRKLTLDSALFSGEMVPGSGGNPPPAPTRT